MCKSFAVQSNVVFADHNNEEQWFERANALLCERLIRITNSTIPFLVVAGLMGLLKAHFVDKTAGVPALGGYSAFFVGSWWITAQMARRARTCHLQRWVLFHAIILFAAATVIQTTHWRIWTGDSIQENSTDMQLLLVARQLLGELGWFYTMIITWYASALRPSSNTQIQLSLCGGIMYVAIESMQQDL